MQVNSRFQLPITYIVIIMYEIALADDQYNVQLLHEKLHTISPKATLPCMFYQPT